VSARSLAVLVLLVAAVAAAVVVSQRDDATAPAAGGRMLPGLEEHLEQVATIEVRTAGGMFTVKRGSSGWRLEAMSGYPAEFDVVRRALVGMARLEKVEAKTADPGLHARLDLAALGRDDSRAVQVRLFDGAGAEMVALLVGKRQTATAGGGDEIFVRLPNEDQTWLVQGDFEVPREPVGWLRERLLGIDAGRIRRARAEHEDGVEVVVERPAPDNEHFTLQGVAEGSEVKYRFAVDDVANSFASIRIEDVRKGEAAGNAGGTLSAVMETFDGLRVSMRAPDWSDEAWVSLSAEYDPGLVQAETAKQADEDDTDGGNGAGSTDPAEGSAAADVEEEASMLNERWSGWLFRPAPLQFERITAPMSELVEAKAAETPAEPSGSGEPTPEATPDS
jgi:hypothetical protein